ncbi:hypothetical protein MRX96_045919 [Rhipicephalus microplus]
MRAKRALRALSSTRRWVRWFASGSVSGTSTCGLPSKIRRQEPSTSACEETAGSYSTESDSNQIPVPNVPAIPDVRKCGLPSAYWARHLIAGADNATVFTVCALDGDKLTIDKYVLMTSDENKLQATAFVQATKIKTLDITDIEMAEELLRDVDSMIPCRGFGKTGEFGVNLKYKEKTFDGRTFSPSCRWGCSNARKKPAHNASTSEDYS